ncbi:MAG: hypothetical protein L3J28_12875 [Candidatus Polarisedimenticolaceae bacterium]|nr:hypothetical protein [Candidatus Polarisedimenticolaceae bacterium]
MRQKNSGNSIMSDHALEMVMVDVLDGMLESSLELGILDGSRKANLLSLVNTGKAPEAYLQQNPKKTPP